MSDKLEIIKLLHSEWQARISRFWSLYFKVAAVAFVFVLLPLLAAGLGVDFSVIKIPPHVFPSIGIIISIAVSIFAWFEADRLVRIKDCLKKNIKLLSNEFDEYTDKGNHTHKWIPLAICVVQIIFAVIIRLTLK